MANLRGQKHFLLCEIGDHAENFWRYPKADMERVHEISRMKERVAKPFPAVSSLNMR